MFGYVEQGRKLRTAWMPVPIIADKPVMGTGKLSGKPGIGAGLAPPIRFGIFFLSASAWCGAAYVI